MRRAALAVTGVGAGVIALGLVAFGAGARFNTTVSLPLGLYWITARPIEPGTTVLFCPPQASTFAEARDRGYLNAGFCPGGYGSMMKRVLATTGDHVAIGADAVRVNGKAIPLSKPMTADGSGRPMPVYQPSSFELSGDQLLLMSDVSAVSFDSRYFGPVGRSQIQAVIRPVFTW